MEVTQGAGDAAKRRRWTGFSPDACGGAALCARHKLLFMHRKNLVMQGGFLPESTAFQLD
jgi:hypothetical protein